MKALTNAIILLGALALLSTLGGCALPGDLMGSKLAKFTHADLQTAAAYATANGDAAGAAHFKARDEQLTACEKALADAVPKPLPADSTVGLATLYEMGRIKLASGIPPAVKLNCAPVALPGL